MLGATSTSLTVGSEAGEDSWLVEGLMPECYQEPPPSGGALLPGQHGRCTLCASCQVCGTAVLSLYVFRPVLGRV